MSEAERRDAILDRIRRIYDDFEEVAVGQIEEGSADEDALIREIARADYNWNKIYQMYECDPVQFMEVYGDADAKEDVDILIDWILYEE